MEQKLFSIIIPTFNPGPKIEKTISSVLSQDDNLFEFLVVDGGSTDDTLDLLAKYEGKIKVVSEKDDGVYDAMNKGIELSTGKYLYFIGAGDSLRTAILAKLQTILPQEEFTFIYGNVYMVDKGVIYDGEFDKAKLKKRNICHQSIFYERKLFEVMGGFETRFRVLADHAFNLKCFWNPRIQRKYIAYLIANYEGGGMSRTERDLPFTLEYAELMSLADE
ncbi:MAG: glycosyltransferase family 2 protein [Pyrinomonadaceae bacterium]